MSNELITEVEKLLQKIEDLSLHYRFQSNLDKINELLKAEKYKQYLESQVGKVH